MPTSNSGKQIEHWRGSFGDDYVDRNSADLDRLRASTAMWARILNALAGQPPASILEVGANVGANIVALQRLSSAQLHAVEPNAKARGLLQANTGLPAGRIYDAVGQSIPLADSSVDMTFTCGVLIHVHPDQLLDVCREMHRVARRTIVCIEYFSVEPEQKSYRGHDELLFKRDFGSFWLDNFPDLTTLDVGFNWKRTTGLDNTTWWVFQKR